MKSLLLSCLATLLLVPQAASRSYVVWDFRIIYEKGAMVMDGGLWLTYDLPAFVEGLEAAGKKGEEPKAQ